MADALASGASVRKDVGVQVPPSAPKELDRMIGFFFYILINILFFRDAAHDLKAASIVA